jgi:NADPH-dependent curcumin reductase CurA
MEYEADRPKGTRRREVEGLENTPKAFIGLFAGENLGKRLVKVS